MKASAAGDFPAQLIFVVGGILNWHYGSSEKQRHSGQGHEDKRARCLGDSHPRMPIPRPQQVIRRKKKI